MRGILRGIFECSVVSIAVRERHGVETSESISISDLILGVH
jgi:hypothetical protein